MPNESMTLTQHLEEVRRRLWIMLVSVAVFSALAFHWSGPIVRWISEFAGELVFLTPAEAFLARLKIAVYCGATASLPVILYEIWRFVSLGLT
ncbi:MAG: twin-arginine translocase subunit TatC, partial [Elusimicrobia bacterium]|nr:twin-arginine translocase subunit TatC [Elusimicrobiota bacterium]